MGQGLARAQVGRRWREGDQVKRGKRNVSAAHERKTDDSGLGESMLFFVPVVGRGLEGTE